MTAIMIMIAAAAFAWLLLDAIERFCPTDRELERRARAADRDRVRREGLLP